MASSPNLIQDLQKELICSICREYFTNPTSIECGHSFCHSCLSSHWQQASTPFSCPECRNVSQLRDFKANVHLGKLAAIVKNGRPRGLHDPKGQGKCEVHQKVLELFCEDDQSLICVSCSRSQEHEVHKIYSIDEAAKKFREKAQETVSHFWSEIGNVIKQIDKEKKKFASTKEEIEMQKKNILSEFQKIKQFLTEEKDEYLSHMETQGKVNLNGLQKNINELCQQNQEIRKRIRELEEENKQADVDFLQNIKGVLTRNESLLQKEIEFFETKMIIHSIPGILERIFNFKVDITLDLNSADPGLIISEDLKSVRYGATDEEVPNHNGRFIDFAQVLATQSFNSGRCYWEVKVPNNTAWCVGICKNSKDFQDFFMLMTVKRHDCYYLYAMAQCNLYSQHYKKYRQVSVPNLKIGVFLDYEHGEISFYHVKKRYLIYTFPTISFSGLLTPFFCLSKKVLTNDSYLMICP
ncbi:putative E3 ubiquitin-protein ligase TRIML1 [Macrotis lagotis]|uniref:putative E3 ubiquitin-protein ligase TRIML1 n=1 Tax=Macrotis lagotis TaxID=92651 RepID=UPI003D68150A